MSAIRPLGLALDMDVNQVACSSHGKQEQYRSPDTPIAVPTTKLGIESFPHRQWSEQMADFTVVL